MFAAYLLCKVCNYYLLFSIYFYYFGGAPLRKASRAWRSIYLRLTFALLPFHTRDSEETENTLFNTRMGGALTLRCVSALTVEMLFALCLLSGTHVVETMAGSPSFCSGFRQMGECDAQDDCDFCGASYNCSIQVLRTVSIAPPRASRVILLSYQMRIGIFGKNGGMRRWNPASKTGNNYCVCPNNFAGIECDMCRVDDACPDSLKCDTGLVAVTNVTEVTVHGKCFCWGPLPNCSVSSKHRFPQNWDSSSSRVMIPT